jgi:hypothetical protein
MPQPHFSEIYHFPEWHNANEDRMSTKDLMDVDEYLRTNFEPDCDYVEGQVVERNLGEIAHSDVQGNMKNPAIEIPLESGFDLNA